MKSLKITNEGEGFYTVVVDHVAGHTTEHEFDNNAKLTAFVNDLKADGYIVVNDAY